MKLADTKVFLTSKQNRFFPLLLVILVSLLGTPILSNAQTGCNLGTITFSVYQPRSTTESTSTPINGKLDFYFGVGLVNTCNTAVVVERAVINQVINGVPQYIGDAQLASGDSNTLSSDRRSHFELDGINVAGLKDANTGNIVRAGGTLTFQAAIKLRGESNFRPSSNTSIAVRTASTPTSTPGGGGNDGTKHDTSGGMVCVKYCPSGTTEIGGTGASGWGNSGGTCVIRGGINDTEDPCSTTANNNDSNNNSSTGGGNFNFANPTGYDDFSSLINGILTWILWISIPIAVIMIIVAGLMMLTAGSTPARFQKGLTTLRYAIIGLAIILIGKGFISLVKSIINLKN